MAVAVVVACVILLVLGLAVAVAWGGTPYRPAWPPPEPGEPAPGGRAPGAVPVAQAFARATTIAIASGLAAGLLVAGAGGRLAMRLLAVTAGDAAQGRVTEADELVGRITIGGTVGFVVFTGLFFGIATGVLYVLVRRWLPGGRLGGAAFGGLLLVLFGTRLEPLRPDNPDFGIVGPGWVAVAAFGALVVVHGMAVAAVAARYSAVLPLPARDRRVLLRYTPLLAAAPVPVVLLLGALAGVAVTGFSQVAGVAAVARSAAVTRAGRVALAVAAAAGLPGFVSGVAAIAG